MRWLRSAGGVLLILVGLLWTLQGINLIGNSGMSGHWQFAVLGIAVILLGAWMLWGALWTRRRTAA